MRGLLGVGYYRSQSAPDLVLYVGEDFYPDCTEMFCRLGMDAGQPHIDHSETDFVGATKFLIRPLYKDKPSSRECHIRRVTLISAAWGNLACPSRGFAKSPVSSEDHGVCMRSVIADWRTEPRSAKTKRVTLPLFEHTELTRAVADGKRALRTLSHDERAALLAHLDKQRLSPQQIASVIGCSHKTVQTWLRDSAALGEPTGDPSVDAIVEMAMGLTLSQRQAIARRILSKPRVVAVNDNGASVMVDGMR